VVPARSPVRLSRPLRRQRILDAAVEAFAARGYGAASMSEIATAAGITKPVLYDHFASKQRLFVEVMESIRDDLVAQSARAMGADRPLEAKLRSAISAFFSYVEQRPAAARVLLVMPQGDPELANAARQVQAGATGALAALLAAEPGLLDGRPHRDRRLELFTELIKQGLHGLAEWWADHPDVPRATLVEAVMDVVWAGLRTHSGSTHRRRGDPVAAAPVSRRSSARPPS
jgi:AcrR family transcriptional regulator